MGIKRYTTVMKDGKITKDKEVDDKTFDSNHEKENISSSFNSSTEVVEHSGNTDEFDPFAMLDNSYGGEIEEEKNTQEEKVKEEGKIIAQDEKVKEKVKTINTDVDKSLRAEKFEIEGITYNSNSINAVKEALRHLMELDEQYLRKYFKLIEVDGLTNNNDNCFYLIISTLKKGEQIKGYIDKYNTLYRDTISSYRKKLLKIIVDLLNVFYLVENNNEIIEFKNKNDFLSIFTEEKETNEAYLDLIMEKYLDVFLYFIDDQFKYDSTKSKEEQFIKTFSNIFTTNEIFTINKRKNVDQYKYKFIRYGSVDNFYKKLIENNNIKYKYDTLRIIDNYIRSIKLNIEKINSNFQKLIDVSESDFNYYLYNLCGYMEKYDILTFKDVEIRGGDFNLHDLIKQNDKDALEIIYNLYRYGVFSSQNAVSKFVVWNEKQIAKIASESSLNDFIQKLSSNTYFDDKGFEPYLEKLKNGDTRVFKENEFIGFLNALIKIGGDDLSFDKIKENFIKK